LYPVRPALTLKLGYIIGEPQRTIELWALGDPTKKLGATLSTILVKSLSRGFYRHCTGLHLQQAHR
jgi:hypothetical protein